MEKWVDAFGVELMLLVFIRLNIFKSWESARALLFEGSRIFADDDLL